MLSERMLKMLNDQVNLEFYSSNIYLQMSSWCNSKGLPGGAEFLRHHAEEEMMHMNKIFDYINESDGMALVGEIKAPDSEFESVKALFEEIYKHECYVTKQINEIAGVAFEEKDFFTFNFLQWYIAEQHEEEALFKGILDKFEIIGDAKNGLFFIDQELSKMAAAEASADSGTE